MDDRVDAAHRVAQRVLVGHVADDDLGRSPRSSDTIAAGARETAHLVAPLARGTRHVRADEARRAGHEQLHRAPPAPLRDRASAGAFNRAHTAAQASSTPIDFMHTLFRHELLSLEL